MTVDKILLNLLKMLGLAFNVVTKNDGGVRNRSGASLLQQNPAVKAVVFICITTLVVSVSSAFYVIYTPEPELPDSSYQELYERSIKQNEAYTSKVENLMNVNAKLKETMLGLQANYKELSKRYEDNVSTTIRLTQQLSSAKDQYFNEIKTSAALEVKYKALAMQYSRLKKISMTGLPMDNTFPDPPLVKPEEGLDEESESSKALKNLINDIKSGE